MPGDPGDAPVAVPGAVRLLLEALFFASAVALLVAANRPLPAALLGGLVLFHYLISLERVRWLLAQ